MTIKYHIGVFSSAFFKSAERLNLQFRKAHVRDVIEIQRQSADYLGHRSRARALDGFLPPARYCSSARTKVSIPGLRCYVESTRKLCSSR